MRETMSPDRAAVDWAAPTLTRAGYRIHAAPGAYAWDVERPDGSWVAVNSVRELCELAREALAAKGA